MMKQRQEHILAIRLKTLGRFLYYQIGGKAGQQRILALLLGRGHLTQKELQDLLEISSGSLSEILQKMEEAGFIQRMKNAEDKRQIDLSLTQHGLESAQLVKAHFLRTQDRMFECLDAAQKDQLEELLDILVTHLDEIKNDPAFMHSPEICCKDRCLETNVPTND